MLTARLASISSNFRITPKIESLVVFAIPELVPGFPVPRFPISRFQRPHSRHFLKISERSVHKFLRYLADTQTDRQTNKVWQNHYLLGGGKY